MNCPLCSAASTEPWVKISQGENYYFCLECQLIWLDPTRRISRREEEARYRTHENVVTDPNYMIYLNRTAGAITGKLLKGAKGLDFGCGPTEGMKALLSPLGFTVDSYDPIFFPELPKIRYSFVLCCEAAEHFFEPYKEFERIDSLLEKGGLLAVSSVLAVEKEKFPSWYYRRDPTHVVFYRETTVRWIANRFGWTLEQLENPLWILKKN